MKKSAVTTFLLIPLLSFGQIINIPVDYPTIQEGINAAQDNDIILVDTGTYYENIDFLDKNITVASNYLYQKDSSFIFNTVIDGSNPSNPDLGSVVSILDGQDTTSVLYGFTITGGSGFYVAGATPYRVGGGIVTSTGCKIESNIITDNHCVMDEPDGFASGGAISAGPVGNVNYIVIKNNLIYNNSAWNNGTASSWDLGLGQGGGIYLAYSGFIEGNIIHSNWCKSTHSYSAGGGIRLQTTIGNTPLVNVNSNEIYNNESISSNATGFGGGICCSIINSMIENNYLYNNTVTAIDSKGGALYFDLSGGSFSCVANNYFIGNHCSGNSAYGGGIGLYAAQNIEFINNLIVENAAAYGGGFYIKESNPIVLNNTISQNIAQTDGGGIYIIDVLSEAHITNTIFWNDSAGGQVNEISALNPDIIEIVYSNIMGWSGTGNINQDPLFINSVDEPYELSLDSPCIDAGTSDTSGLNLPIDDLLGNFRIWDGDGDGDTIIDMGAYEYGSPPVGIDNPIDFTTLHNDGFLLYPNPAHAIIIIELPAEPSKNTSLTISNANGQQLITQPIIKPQTEIDISHLPNGIYILKVWNDKDVMVRKVIIR